MRGENKIARERNRNENIESYNFVNVQNKKRLTIFYLSKKVSNFQWIKENKLETHFWFNI